MVNNSQRHAENILSGSKGTPGRKGKSAEERHIIGLRETTSAMILERASSFASYFASATFLVRQSATISERIERTRAKLARLERIRDFTDSNVETLKEALGATGQVTEYVSRKLAAMDRAQLQSANIDAMAHEAESLFARLDVPTLPSLEATENESGE